MSSFVTIIGASILALMLAGYYGQKYLPPPAPKIFGIDLGTTFSCIGAFHPGSGTVSILRNEKGQQCIPSVVAFDENGTVLVGYGATKQADQNPENTFFDAKRFIGKQFSKQEFDIESKRYPFKIELMADGFVKFKSDRSAVPYLSPELISAQILMALKKTAEKHFAVTIAKVVMSVPAEFDELQRAHTVLAGKLAKLQVMRLINEPTAAALAYGLHNKTGVHDVLVVDLGGGTLDVSLLDIQGGMLLTMAMAGNNRLGGQDFNERLRIHITSLLEQQIFGKSTDIRSEITDPNHKITDPYQKITDPNDIQLLRNAVEDIKIALTFNKTVNAKFKLIKDAGMLHIFDHAYLYSINSPENIASHVANHLKSQDVRNTDLKDENNRHLHSDIDYNYSGKDELDINTNRLVDSIDKIDSMTNDSHKMNSNYINLDDSVITLSIDRSTFNALNYDLFLSILEPIIRVIEEAELTPSDVEEIVLVGGSTRIPRVREIISEFFGGRAVRTDVDPEVAVAMGVSLQAGIMGGAWPLSVSALEVPYSAAKKIQLL